MMIMIADRSAEMTMGQRVSGSWVKWVNKSEWVSTRDPLTHDFVFFQTLWRLTAQLKPQRQSNSVVSTEYFVAVMMFDFESTST